MYSIRQRGGKRWLPWLVLFALIVLVGTYGYWAIKRPLPDLKPNLAVVKLQAQTPSPKLTWPAQGQAAAGIFGSPALETHGKQQPTPTASTAKMVTALTVLRRKPLKPGEQGPIITLAANDVAIYNAYLVHDGSLVKVQTGEQITEYQMLEAMLLPSANNMADSLAIWAFGSLKAYSLAANQYLEDQGLTQTRIGSDASGFDPSTTSTAHDLVRIGEFVMQNPILAQIVAQPGASGIPVVGNIKNVNFLLGTNNVIGIKTGNTDQAGGVFVSASRVNINNKPVTIVTALAASPTLLQALKDSTPLIQSAQVNFSPVIIIKAGQIVGTYRLPWGGGVPAIASQTLKTAAWNGSPVTATANLRLINANSSSGQSVGSLSISGPLKAGQTIGLQLAHTPSQPSAWWRLTHPF